MRPNTSTAAGMGLPRRRWPRVVAGGSGAPMQVPPGPPDAGDGTAADGAGAVVAAGSDGAVSGAPAAPAPSGDPGVDAPTAVGIALDWPSRLRWGLVVAGLVAGLLYLTWSVLAILAAAVVIAYLMDRPVTWLAGRGISREVAFFGLVVAGCLGAVVFVIGVVPVVASQFAELATNLTPYLARLGDQLRPYQASIEARLGAPIPLDVQSLQSVLPQYAQKIAALPKAGEVAQDVLASVATGGAHVIVSMLTLALVPVFTFYVCRDWPLICAGAEELVPHRWRPEVHAMAVEIDGRVMAFVRGQALLCGILGVLYSIGFLLCGVDLAILVGMVSGALFIIPYAGAVIGVGVAAALALLKFGLDWHVLGVLGTYVVVHLIEGSVLTPNIVGDRVGLHPLVVMVGIIVCGNLLGIWGLMLAVPLTAALSVLGATFMRTYRGSRFYAA